MLRKPKWTLENGGIQAIAAQPGHFAAEPVFHEEGKIGSVYLTPILAWLISDQGYAQDDGDTGEVAVTAITLERGSVDCSVMWFDDGGDGYFYAPFDRRIGHKTADAIAYMQNEHDELLERKARKAGAR